MLRTHKRLIFFFYISFEDNLWIGFEVLIFHQNILLEFQIIIWEEKKEFTEEKLFVHLMFWLHTKNIYIRQIIYLYMNL